MELKQRVPGLRLKKSTPAQSPAAPFPITAAAEVEAPPAADRYDVASFGLLARLGAGVAAAATSAPQAGDASHSQQQAGAATVADAVEMEVVSAELPRVLRQAMAAELHRTWAASNPGEQHGLLTCCCLPACLVCLIAGCAGLCRASSQQPAAHAHASPFHLLTLCCCCCCRHCLLQPRGASTWRRCGPPPRSSMCTC